MSLIEKVKSLESELFVTREQLDRTSTSKLDNTLNVQKSAFDKTRLGFIESVLSSDVTPPKFVGLSFDVTPPSLTWPYLYLILIHAQIVSSCKQPNKKGMCQKHKIP